MSRRLGYPTGVSKSLGRRNNSVRSSREDIAAVREATREFVIMKGIPLPIRP